MSDSAAQTPSTAAEPAGPAPDPVYDPSSPGPQPGIPEPIEQVDQGQGTESTEGPADSAGLTDAVQAELISDEVLGDG
jgi:hypothetical protein